MAAAAGPGEAGDSFWEMLADVARLQRELGSDMVAWAKVYEAAGEALQRNAVTTALMAEMGRRGERYLREGPPAAARQALQFFFNPLQAMGSAAPGPVVNPFARFWEAWAGEGSREGGPQAPGTEKKPAQ